MADNTAIEWADATWQPITGCAVVSPGCTNCYAMRLAGTRLARHPSRAGLTVDSKAGPVWTGETRLNEDWLTQPLRWKRPRRIFVCAHGDLFAESVPDAWIDRVFAVMALAPQHTFQVLTKRARRMRDYVGTRACDYEIVLAEHAVSITRSPCAAHVEDVNWPLPNVWLGVSVEDQARADERIPDLLATPAAVRFVSAEPLLGPVDFFGPEMDGPLTNGEPTLAQIEADPTGWRVVRYGVSRLDWIIVGGESGPGARPMHPDWARAIRDQCAAAGVAFFFKQNGEWQHMPERAHFKEQFREEWRRVESGIPGVRPALMFRVGKKRAGRLLDGYTHDDMPGSRATL